MAHGVRKMDGETKGIAVGTHEHDYVGVCSEQQGNWAAVYCAARTDLEGCLGKMI